MIFSAPSANDFEEVCCYLCGSKKSIPLLTAQEDLTGKAGDFTFVTCADCGLAYQSPRLKLERIKDYYDDEYIAHRKKTNWGILTPLYNWAMNRHDKAKIEIISRYSKLNKNSQVLDIGCGAAGFLFEIKRHFGAKITGVDFKDLSKTSGFEQMDFRCGLFYEQNFEQQKFNLITMWHFLEHDYDPIRTLNHASKLLNKDGFLIIEVPRLDSISYRLYKNKWPGLQAPQHTVLYDRKSLENILHKTGYEIVDYLPYGAFPAYFYLFAGLAFTFLKGRGLNLDRAILPYFIGQALLSPLLLFERHLNLAMQTVIVRPK